MANSNQKHRSYLITLLLCILQIAGMDAYAQTPVNISSKDSVIVREAPKARARRYRDNAVVDSLAIAKNGIRKDSIAIQKIDSTKQLTIVPSVADSLENINKINIKKITTAVTPIQLIDSVAPIVPKKIFIPNPTKATWLAIVFPGGGQIYNRKYWKLPIFYGGFVGCAYALSWNTKTYNDYSQAYLDIMDSDPNTNSYLNIIPPGYSESQMKDVLKKRKDIFRRYRDLSIFAFIGVYLISVIDAYVDAELSDFDITPDLSMKVEPTMINDRFNANNKSVGLQCSFRF